MYGIVIPAITQLLDPENLGYSVVYVPVSLPVLKAYTVLHVQIVISVHFRLMKYESDGLILKYNVRATDLSR